MTRVSVQVEYCEGIELFYNGLKGELVKHGGGKTSDLLCNKSWWINTGNVDDSVTLDILTAAFIY